MIFNYYDVYMTRLNFCNSINADFFSVLNIMEDLINTKKSIEFLTLQNNYESEFKLGIIINREKYKKSIENVQSNLNKALNTIQIYNPVTTKSFLAF